MGDSCVARLGRPISGRIGRISRWEPHAFLFAALFFLPACSTVDLGEANKLAVAGQKTSTALEEEAAFAASDYALSSQRSSITTSLAPRTAKMSESAKKLAKEYSEEQAKVLELIKLRVAMLEALANAYKAFGELVNYDAYAPSRDATVEFVGSANQLIGFINSTWKDFDLPTISGQASGLAATGFGVIAEQSRRRDITRVNLVLLDALKKVKLALEAESQIAISYRQDSAIEKAGLREVLFHRKLVDYSPFVQEFARLAGTTATPDSNKIVRKDPQSQAAIASYLKEQEEAEQKKIEDTYLLIFEALDELIKQHEKLEKEKRVDVAQLLVYAKDFREAYGASAK